MHESTTLSAKVYVDANPNTSCGYHRLVLPFSQLFVETKVPIVVFNRLHSGGLSHLKLVKAEGGKILADVDDLPELDSQHYLFDRYKENGTSQRIVQSLKMADIVMTTNVRLASELMSYGIERKRLAIVPNCLPFDQGQFVRNKRYDDGPVYAAGPSHLRDARILPVGLPRLTFAGYERGHPEWEKIRQAHPQANYKANLPLDRYMDAYETHSIALAPLRPSRFNACKSNLKMLEAGARGIPLIASAVDPYIDPTDWLHVLSAPQRADWHRLVSELLHNKAIRRERGEALAQYVRETYQLERANKVRKQLIEALQ